MDFQTGSAALKIDLASLGLPVKGVVEARVVDQVMYMKLGDLLRGEKWCSPRDAGRNRKDSRS